MGSCKHSAAYTSGADYYCDSDASLPNINGLLEIAAGTTPPAGDPNEANYFKTCTIDADCGAGNNLMCRYGQKSHFWILKSPTQIC